MKQTAFSLNIAQPVRDALQGGRPVVALESALITHGLPYPHNLETAQLLEKTIRAEHAVPATVAVLGGRLKVGLTGEELERLAGNRAARKVSLRDFPIVVARGEDGGTTVAATIWLAHRAGIQVFATGGIGGVHRGHPFDVSADLVQLATTPIAVVCAGAKAILDLPLTMEWLETHGVPVLGFQTDEFPAFYSRGSGLPVDARVDSPEEAARLSATQWALGLTRSVLVGVPVPAHAAIPAERIQPAIQQALAEAAQDGLTGKAVTPFLLARVASLTGGESLAANIALLENNARVAARIASALAALTPEDLGIKENLTT